MPNRIRARRRRLLGIITSALALAAACSGGEPSGTTSTLPPATTTTTGVDGPPATTADESLAPLLLTLDDLPEGYSPGEDVDDTITAFCAGQDATAGLRASARDLVGFTRTPPGASVIQIVFRFEAGGAATFVEQSEALLGGCNEVPDATGLAFTYEALTPALTDVLASAHASTGRYGTSIGSGALTINIVAFHRDDLAQLVAVLGVDQDRASLDALALEAFTVAVDRLTG